LRQGVQGISDLITVHGLINLDFADVKAVMNNSGSALMGIGRANGENRAVVAAQQAIESPLLEVSIDGARGILFNVIGGNDLSMHEINAAAETITTAADPEANVIFGATINPELDGEVIITVVATGFDASYYAKRGGTTMASLDDASPKTSAPVAVGSSARQDEKALSEIDMNLDDDNQAASEFNKDHAMPNIWTIDDDEEEPSAKQPEERAEPVRTPTISRSDDDDDDADDKSDEDSTLEDDLERPSFLRRLSNRRHKDEKKPDEK